LPHITSSRRCRSKLKWKIGVYSLVVLSIVLIIETVYCLVSPSNYPTDNLKGIVTVRSVGKDPNIIIENYTEPFSSVTFVEAPTNTKQEMRVNLNSLSEADIDWAAEIYITENVTVHFTDFRFLAFEEVSNLEVFVNGQKAKYNCSMYEGKKYYFISGFDITRKDEITKIEIHFKIEQSAGKDQLTRIPWLFNENYARVIHIPIANIPVQRGSKCDVSRLRINLGLPFQRILIEHSGWIDVFYPPKDEWGKYLADPKSGLYLMQMFEYPIEQEHSQEGNSYVFKVTFSEDNLASDISLVIVPDLTIPLTLILFLCSPLYISLTAWAKKEVRNKSTKVRMKAKSRLSNIRKKLSLVFLVIELYAGPLLGGVLSFVFGKEISLSMFSYLAEITNPLVLLVVIMYPAIFFVFHWQMRKVDL